MDFIDFELRAWQADDAHVQALVHSSPVGGMRQPVAVPFDAASLEAFRRTFTDFPTSEQAVKWADLIAGGKQLAAVLLPPPVYSLLIRCLERISPDDGLRLRLCLDGALADLPWECLYRPDTTGQSPSEGFLALDSRISLVREAPTASATAPRPRRKQHLLFAGAPFMVRGEDYWRVELERQNLEEALKPVNDLLSMESVTADKMSFETALSHEGIDIFHYSGHTGTNDDRGFLVEEIKTERTDNPRFMEWQWGTDRVYFDPLYVEKLSNLLRRAGTRLAVFSACNSGRWSFVEPLLRAGLPVVIGAQGMLDSMAAVAFSHKLYEALAIGLSLDEAVTWARMSLLEPDTVTDDIRWQWAMFMVYMPTPDAVLFPKPKLAKIQGRQESIRSQRQQTVINIGKLVYQDIDQQIGKVEGSGQVVGSSIEQIKDQ